MRLHRASDLLRLCEIRLRILAEARSDVGSKAVDAIEIRARLRASPTVIVVPIRDKGVQVVGVKPIAVGVHFAALVLQAAFHRRPHHADRLEVAGPGVVRADLVQKDLVHIVGTPLWRTVEGDEGVEGAAALHARLRLLNCVAGMKADRLAHALAVSGTNRPVPAAPAKVPAAVAPAYGAVKKGGRTPDAIER